MVSKSKTYTVIPTHYISQEVVKACGYVTNPIVVLDSLAETRFNFANYVATLQERNPNTIVLISTWKNSYATRNIGIDKAISEGAEFILFTDADCIPTMDWEDLMLEQAQTKHIVVGWTNEITQSEILESYKTNAYGLGTNGIKFYQLGIMGFPTCNVGYHVDVFKTIGNFPVSSKSGGDFMFSGEAAKNYMVGIAYNAVVNHYICKGLKDLFLKRVRYGSFVLVNWWFLLMIPGLILEQIGFFLREAAYTKSKKKLLYHVIAELTIHTGFFVGRIIYIFKRRKRIF